VSDVGLRCVALSCTGLTQLNLSRYIGHANYDSAASSAA